MNRARTNHRAFVTPLVLAVLLFAGLLLSAMLTRQTSQSRAVFGQTDSYKSVHAERGLLTLADAAREAATTGEFAEFVLLSGAARRFEGKGVLLSETDLGGGVEARVYAAEAQGSISLEVTGSGGLVQSQPVRLLLALRNIVEAGENDEQLRAERLAKLTRAKGPAQVSVFTAPEEVLRAAAQVALYKSATGPADSGTTQADAPRDTAEEGAADGNGREPDTGNGSEGADPGLANALVTSLLSERTSESWKREVLGNNTGLSTWLNELGITGQTLQAANQFLTSSPTLFRMRVEIVDDGRVVRAFSGLFDTAQRGGESVSSRSEFLTWNEIDLDAESGRQRQNGRASRR